MSAGSDLLEQLMEHITEDEQILLKDLLTTDDFIDGFFIGRFPAYSRVTMYNVAEAFRTQR